MADVAAGVITDVATAPVLHFDAAAVSAITVVVVVVVIVAPGIIFDVAGLILLFTSKKAGKGSAVFPSL